MSHTARFSAALCAGPAPVQLPVAVLSVLLTWLPAWAGDWPQFLGPARNATSPETMLLASFSDKGPPRLWEREVGSGYSGVAVAGDRLILFHRVGPNEVVECLDAISGKERWKFAYPTSYEDQFRFDDGPRSTPTIAGQRVYTLGAEGQLHCLELDTGKKVWARMLNADYKVPQGFFGVTTSPLVETDLVLINVGGKSAGIVALHADSGKEAWRATNHEASNASPIAATIGGTRHVFFLTREGIVAVDPKGGNVRFRKRWRARISASVNAASPVVDEDQVFFSASYNTGAILIQVGKDRFQEVWQSDDVLSNHYNTSVCHDGHLYGIHGRQEYGAELRCVEWKTGTMRWTKEGFGCASMIAADGKLIILTENGDLVLVDATPQTYREKARATVLSKPCRAEIALANGRLYARDGKRLICLNVRP